MQIVKRTALAKRFVLPTIDLEPEPYVKKDLGKRVAIFDTETDPFEPGLVVKPFTCGFWLPDTQEYFDFWGDDCIDQFFKFLTANFAEEELCIFVHNGGNFDFYFFPQYFDAGHKPFIINGRLVKIVAGGQEFRDSYAMIPVALGTYDKIKFDYDKMKLWSISRIDTHKVVPAREFYRDEILAYQKRDCTSLGELVTGWLDMFGARLTMASAALPMLKSHHGFETLNDKLDREFRPYYFGGRNQCFAVGVMRGQFKVYDINSSYPDVMRRYKHPIGGVPTYEAKITSRTHFAYIRAWSLGALPVREANGSLTFPIGTHDFYACIHEINAGIETGTLRIVKVYHTVYFDEEASFAEFVDTFYRLRLEADANGDAIRKLFYKLVLNSSYGKFAQDPRKYENWLFDPEEIPTPRFCEICCGYVKKGLTPPHCALCEAKHSSPYGWYLHTTRDGRNIYASPQRVRAGSFFNVATAASITSAARASLIRGIQAATRPLYCDTDSVICEGMAEGNGVVLHPSNLGAWDCEAEGDTVCIAGKKLYAIFNAGKEVKKASKGVKLTASEIRRVCEGEVIEYAHPIPKFKLSGDVEFTTRRIRKTA